MNRLKRYTCFLGDIYTANMCQMIGNFVFFNTVQNWSKCLSRVKIAKKWKKFHLGPMTECEIKAFSHSYVIESRLWVIFEAAFSFLGNIPQLTSDKTEHRHTHVVTILSFHPYVPKQHYYYSGCFLPIYSDVIKIWAGFVYVIDQYVHSTVIKRLSGCIF